MKTTSSPSKDLAIKKEIAPVIQSIQTLKITVAKDMTDATSLLSKLNSYLDSMTVEKEKITKPLNAALKEVRDRYKPTETILTIAITDLKKKMSVYQTEQLRITAEKQEKIANRVSSGNIKVETGIRKLGELDTPKEKIHTDEGSVGFRTVKKFEVVDITKLPIKYHIPDEAAIRLAMRDGLELDGVRYYEEQSIINKR